jgi:hypothetical protein
MYILYLLQQKDDEGREIRPLTTVILDNDIIPSASITGENSIEGKVVLLDSDKITIMR